MTGVRLPGPPQGYAGPPDAVVDLRTEEGAALVGGTWRYADASVVEVDFPSVGPDLAPSGPLAATYDLTPHAQAADFDDTGWSVLAPAEVERRRSHGLVCFAWYRIAVTVPERLGAVATAGSTIVFEVVVDDYAEVWVDGELPLVLGQTGGAVVSGFNAPNRVVLTRDARPGRRIVVAVLGINGPLSASPRNFIWLRSATLDVYAAGRPEVSRPVPLDVDRRDPALAAVVAPGAALEQVADGFDGLGGAVWAPPGYLLCSAPVANVIYRWAPQGTVEVFRTKSGYAGADIATLAEPGSDGLALDPQGRLTICQRGARRVLRVEPHGDVTVLADDLGTPLDCVYRADGTLYVSTAEPGGVHEIGGEVVARLAEPRGLALSPDQRVLYVGDGDTVQAVALPGGRPEALVHLGAEGPVRGLAADSRGRLFACAGDALWVVAPHGAILGRLGLPEEPRGLAWGEDGATLFVTTTSGIHRLRTGASP